MCILCVCFKPIIHQMLIHIDDIIGQRGDDVFSNSISWAYSPVALQIGPLLHPTVFQVLSLVLAQRCSLFCAEHARVESVFLFLYLGQKLLLLMLTNQFFLYLFQAICNPQYIRFTSIQVDSVNCCSSKRSVWLQHFLRKSNFSEKLNGCLQLLQDKQ